MDNEVVNLAEEVVNKVSDRLVGESVEMEIERDNKRIQLSIPTIESKAEKGRPVVGIYITTLNWQPVIP